MKSLKTAITFAVSMLAGVMFAVSVSAADAPSGAMPPESANRVEIFTAGHGYYINYKTPSASLLDAVESVEIATLKKSGGNYFSTVDSTTYYGYTYMPFMADRSYFDFDEAQVLFYEPAAQIRAKLAALTWSETPPADITANHIRITVPETIENDIQIENYSYGGITISNMHFNKYLYSAALTQREADWFAQKTLETAGAAKDTQASPEDVAVNQPDYFYFNFMNANKASEGSGHTVTDSGTFMVWTEDDKTYVEAQENNVEDGRQINTFWEADAAIFEGLDEIMRGYKAEDWDRTYANTEVDNVIQYFSLESVYGGGVTQTYRYGVLPEDYDAFKEDIFDFFAAYSEDAPVFIPQPEKIKNVQLVAGGYSADVYGRFGEDFTEIERINVDALGDSHNRSYDFYSYAYILNDYIIPKDVHYDFDFDEEAFISLLEKALGLDYMSSEDFYNGFSQRKTGYTSIWSETGYIIIEYTTPGNSMGRSIYAMLNPDEEKRFINQLNKTLKGALPDA